MCKTKQKNTCGKTQGFAFLYMGTPPFVKEALSRLFNGLEK